MDVSLALAFVAGLASFASPCVLALVPVYVAFLGESAALPAGGGVLAARPSVLPQALLFVAGFAAVFVLLGTSVGLLGGALFRIDIIRQTAGIVVIALGLLTTGIFGPVLDRLALPLRPDRLPEARSVRSLALGAMVSVGWTPCIGPVLAAILGMGGSTGSALIAGALLVAYSAGLAVPFLLAAVGLRRLEPVVLALRRHHRAVEVTSGLLIMAIGGLIYVNAFGRLASVFTLFL
ncbi:MAG: cytochrome c biogenesis CcdA family protein [Candidatus Limnocylindria bacterium]